MSRESMRHTGAFRSAAALVVRVVAALCLLTVPAVAQDFTGTWYGRIESPLNNQYRKLVVTMVGTKLSCAFVQIAARSGGDSTCSIEGGALQLVTATQNGVRLVVRGDVLDGTTTAASTGKSFHIRMARDPAKAGIPPEIRTASEYTFGVATTRPIDASWISSMILEGGSPRNCSHEQSARFTDWRIEIKGKTFRADPLEGDSGDWSKISLNLDSLSADGSGKITVKSRTKGLIVFFTFEPGSGPRKVHFGTDNFECRYVFVPK